MSSHQCPTGTEDTLSVALLQLIYLSIHRLYIIMRSPSSRSRRLYDSSRTIVSRDTLLSGSPDPPLSLTFKNLETWATTSECICRSVNARKCYVLPTRLIQISPTTCTPLTTPSSNTSNKIPTWESRSVSADPHRRRPLPKRAGSGDARLATPEPPEPECCRRLPWSADPALSTARRCGIHTSD